MYFFTIRIWIESQFSTYKDLASPSLLTGGMPLINAVQWYFTVYILTEAGLLIILQEGIKVQADFTLCNMMHMVSVDMELQSSCLLLDRPLEESGL